MNKFPQFPSVLGAIRTIIPDAVCAIHNEDLNRIDWMMDDTPQPSISEIQTKLDELKAQYPMKVLRYQRDNLLAETDWISSKYYDLGQPVPDEWKSYRQALRDLPETSTPVLDPSSPIGISGVDWPVKPE